MYDGFRLGVLLDPSMLVGERSFKAVMEYVDQRNLRGYGYSFYIPERFMQLLEEESREMMFFIDKAKSINISHLRDVANILRKKQAIQAYSAQGDEAEKYATFHGNLLRETGNKEITEILFQEWVFLQENNLMVSRIKKPFTYFLRAGATGIEYKTETEAEEHIQGLKKLAKWTALAGKPTKKLTEQLENAIRGEGFFLLTGSE